MTIRVAIRHNTKYTFKPTTELSPHVVRLRPAAHCRTPIQSYSLKIKPEKHFINWQQDAFGNYLARIVFEEPAKELEINVEVIADMTVINPFDFFLEDYAEDYPFKYPAQLKKELLPYLKKNTNGKRFTQLVNSISKEKRRTIDFLVDINSTIQQKIEYNVRMEPGVQSPEDTLKKANGSCRDSSWLLLQALRHLGLAARFASGYLVQLTPDEKSLDGPSGAEQDFTDLHAWCEVFLPGAGWVGLDPTSGLFASEGHIPLACTPDPASAAPIEGFTGECEVSFDYSNVVDRVHEDPRVTKPYTDAQWAEALALGDAVDKELVANDVRLTMGGEPTFVSVNDMESAQWNTEALGDDKLSLAKSLSLKLRDHFAPQGLLHYGQGKWYPGEPLPRWALGVFWRKDGEPLWQNPALLAHIDKDYKHDIDSAESFANTLAATLDIDSKYINPAFEDALHYLMEEQRVPLNIQTKIAAAKDSLERKRLIRVLQQGFDKAAGFVLPLEFDAISDSWITSNWPLRSERLILIPGDSPLGLRLPLEELPLEAQPEVKQGKDPLDSVVPLQARHEIIYSPVKQTTISKQSLASKDNQKKTKQVVRTAVCIEARAGKIHLFLPPLHNLESYVELLKVIEEVANKLSMPVVIEGYEPPSDSRLQKLLVTPDPGVIEVNVQPTSNWRDQVANTTNLYELARECRLGTEKFMLDGRHTGTGGGNHITLGGAKPADSPMLRKPELLRSFVSFWQHHPSLSYVFSGAFIGPTSQAPRADEGREEMLYEMEIAFQQMPAGMADKPWLVDRLMRNLLIDITGNTHRAEFCIDKLYAPNSATGRLGILEFRGFEMPPHSRMALVQALLIRTLVARFWSESYNKPLVRWGTALHDKYMLPHYLWQDMKEVVADLEARGYPFKADWLLPFEEFRFPHYGRVKLDDIEIELRWAVEPWHVLGEEVGSTGNARYVDSSVERLQVKVTGLTDGRYVLACNGRRVPISNTGRQGEYVAGVRYRAWSPPSALHPTIGVHTPLVFDLIDTWNGRSIGGCSYHISHPGGLSYTSLPVNAFEAESRRGNRFENLSHTQGLYTEVPELEALREFFPNHDPKPMEPPPEESPDEYPHTLDLRRKGHWIG
jgi:uncharacterized protein (DUF2126 family)/transglutaminase-like putative cysteine protease